MLPTSIAAHISKMVKDAGEDCTAKSCFAAARLKDIVQGLKDDCKIEIFLVHLLCMLYMLWWHIGMKSLFCVSQVFLLDFFSSTSTIGDALLYNDYSSTVKSLCFNKVCFSTNCFKLMLEPLLLQTACFTVNWFFFDALLQTDDSTFVAANAVLHC
jgi:hypothetical protein